MSRRAKNRWTTQLGAALRPQTHSHPCHRNSLERGSARGFIISTTPSRRPASGSSRVLMCEFQSAPLSNSQFPRRKLESVRCGGAFRVQGARNRLAAKYQRPGFIPHLRRSPSLQRSSCKRYREVIQILLKSLSCRYPRRTNSDSRPQRIIPTHILDFRNLPQLRIGRVAHIFASLCECGGAGSPAVWCATSRKAREVAHPIFCISSFTDVGHAPSRSFQFGFLVARMGSSIPIGVYSLGARQEEVTSRRRSCRYVPRSAAGTCRD